MIERYNETEDFLEIPETNSKFFINILGIVKDNMDNILIIGIDSFGNKTVKINWILGYKDYVVSLLLAFAFKPTFVPVKYWDKINIIFRDYDNKNIHPSNIVWKFPTGLGAKEYDGYAFIPMYSRYLINREGCIRNIVSYFKINLRSTFSTELKHGKYHQFTINPDIGPITTISRHRALCLAWKDYPASVDILTPNHINGIKGDDRLQNLEWATHKENINHAFLNGLNKGGVGSHKSIPVLVRDVITKTETCYRSIKEASRNIGITNESIKWRLQSRGQRVFPELKQYKSQSEILPWKEIDNYEFELLNNEWANPVLVRNCVSGEIKEYKTQRICAKALNISEATLCSWLQQKGQPIFPGKIQIQLKRYLTEWRIPINLEYEFDLIGCGKSVLVKNIKTNTVLEFQSVTECARYIGILKTSIVYRLKTKGQKVYPGNLLFKYKSDPTAWLELSEKEIENLRFSYNAK